MNRSRAIAAAVLVAGAAALLLARAGRILQPVGDIALIELYTREALAGRLLEGPYSHFPWHHPGPLYFYVLAPFYALGSETPSALNAGAAALSLATLGTLLWLLLRRLPAWSAAVVFGCIVLFALRVDGLLVSVWNPHIVLLPMALFLIASSGLASGDTALLPLVVAVGSFAVQTDVAVVPVVATTGIVALIALVRSGRLSNRDVAIALAIGAVVWSLPVLEQGTGRTGNLAALARFFATPHASQPLGTAFDAWSVAMATPFRALNTLILLPSGNGVAPANGLDRVAASALVGITMAVAAMAMRRGGRAIGWLATTAALASLAAFASIARIDGPITDHQVFWMAIIAVVDLSAVLTFVAAQLIEPAARRAGVPATIMCLLLGASIVSGLVQMNRARQGAPPATEFLPSIANFGESIRQYVESSGAREPLVRIDQEPWGIAAGILLQLHRIGVPFHVEDSWASMFPRRFRESGTEDLELAIVTTGTHRQLSEREGDTLVDRSTHVEVHARRIR